MAGSQAIYSGSQSGHAKTAKSQVHTFVQEVQKAKWFSEEIKEISFASLSLVRQQVVNH